MPFDYQPTLHGDHVTIRPLCDDDFDQLFAVASDPLIWEQHPAKDRCTEEGFKRFFDEARATTGALLALDAKTGEVIGSSRFFRHNEAASEVEIGWTFLARKCWGGLYNREMKALMLRHAFQFVEAVVLLVAPDNIRSQRAVEKIGGVREGIRIDCYGNQSMAFLVTTES